MNKHTLGSDFYDNAYLSSKAYNQHYSKSPYLKIWTSIIDQMDPRSKIADFGCGPGQFAHFCADHGFNYLVGIDFSPVAIQKCVDSIPCSESAMCSPEFICNKLEIVTKWLHIHIDYDTAVFLETLEHVADDIEILENLPEDIDVVISVPNWDSVSHVRHFKTRKEAVDRYNKVLKNVTCVTHKLGGKKSTKKIYVIYGNR